VVPKFRITLVKIPSSRIFVVMVGLPARGKTYVSHKLCRYLNWLGYDARTFNVGEYRRRCVGPEISHDFFAMENEEGREARKLAAKLALQDLIQWLTHMDPDLEPHSEEGDAFSPPIGGKVAALKSAKKSQVEISRKRRFSRDICLKNYSSASPNFSGSDTLGSFIFSKIEESHNKVAIYDATNTTSERRQWIVRSLLDEGIGFNQILFIELICHDTKLIDDNISLVKLLSPDYVHTEDKEKAILDFKLRIQHYEECYEEVTPQEFALIIDSLKVSSQSSDIVQRTKTFGVPIIKIINVTDQMTIMNCHQYWQSRIAYYLMNLHISPRTIYFCRHGESENNMQGKIGGDSDLSPHGLQFAQLLPKWIHEHFGKDKSLSVWTSTLKRTIQTAQYLDYPKLCWKALDELDAGCCDGLSYVEIEAKYPADFHARDKDKYHYRYPEGGESYADLVLRLEPIMMELERQSDILIISHQAVLRAIFSYFVGIDREKLPYVKIPLHTIIELSPKAYGCQVTYHPIDVPAVDTHRDKPVCKI
jgi:broad specificity phosphatase PhoE